MIKSGSLTACLLALALALPLAVEGQSTADCHARLTVYVDQSASMAAETNGISPEKYILDEMEKFLRSQNHPFVGGHVHLTFVPFGKNLERVPAEVQEFDENMIGTWRRLQNERHQVDRSKTNLVGVLADIKSNEIDVEENSEDRAVVIVASDFLHDYSPNESMLSPERHFKAALAEMDFCRSAIDSDKLDLMFIDAGATGDKGHAFEARSYLEGCLAKKPSFMDSDRSIGDELNSRIKPFVTEALTYDHHEMVQRLKLKNTWCNSAVIKAFRIEGSAVNGEVKIYDEDGLMKPEVVEAGAETRSQTINIRKVLKDSSRTGANGKDSLSPSFRVTALGANGSNLAKSAGYYEISRPVSVVLGSRFDIYSARAQVDDEIIRVSVAAKTNLPLDKTKVFLELLSSGVAVDGAWLADFAESEGASTSFAADLKRPNAKIDALDDYCVRLLKSPQIRVSFDGVEGVEGVHEVNLSYEGVEPGSAVLEPTKEIWQNFTVSVMLALVVVLVIGLGHGISLGMIDSKFGVLAVIIGALFSVFHYGTVSGGGLEDWFIVNMGELYILVCCIIGLLWFLVIGPALIFGSGRVLVWRTHIRRGKLNDAIVSSSIINALILTSVPFVVALLVLEILRNPTVADGCAYSYHDSKRPLIQQEAVK